MVLFSPQPVKGGHEGKACGVGPRTPGHGHGAAAQGGAGRQDGSGASREQARVRVWGAGRGSGRWGWFGAWGWPGSGILCHPWTAPGTGAEGPAARSA